MPTNTTKSITWKWRSYFSKNYLDQAIIDEMKGRIETFSMDSEGHWAMGTTTYGFQAKVTELPTNYPECKKIKPWSINGIYSYANWAVQRDDRFSCTCSIGGKGGLCRHIANLMLHVEKVRGPFIFEETEEDRIIRLKEEERERARMLREKQRVSKQKKIFPAMDFLQDYVDDISDELHFQPASLLNNVQTNEYESEQAQEFLSDGGAVLKDDWISYNYHGEQELHLELEMGNMGVSFGFLKDRISEVHCSCGRSRPSQDYYYWGRDPQPAMFCAHALAAYVTAWKWIVRENPGDETDRNADRLLKLLADHTEAEKIPEIREEKEAILVLTPRIVTPKNSGRPELAFQLGMAGGKNIAVRSLEKLVDAVDASSEYELSKTVTLDFKSMTFTEDSARWYSFILARVRNIQSLNEKLDGGYYYARHLGIGSSVPLVGSDLDVVYDLAQGSQLLYQPGGRGSDISVPVGTGIVKAEITLTPLKSDQGNLMAIDFQGTMPRLLKGNQYEYVLDQTQFGRVSGEELKVLEPYRVIAREDGSFQCTIGRKKFPEFYYRILPELKTSRFLILHDEVGDLQEGLLPQEPEFVFYLDLNDEYITCRAEAGYGDVRFPLGAAATREDQERQEIQKRKVFARDRDQEKRVLGVVKRYFSDTSDTTDAAEFLITEAAASLHSVEHLFLAPASEENMIRILTEGITVLSGYGVVKGSNAFRKVHVQPAPQTKVSVSIEGGLLDLSIQTKDLTDGELLELLSSYRLKKRWHRLKSGDFVDLRDAEGLRELEELSEALDTGVEDLIHGKVKIPKYRALYVDKLLESHDAIAASRDRNFKSLVRSFGTIKDSDFEAAGDVAETMRPYQLYGFRWLSTLATSGFGGILADEMGLGKTIQMLSLIETMRVSGEKKPSLVICPASLVYNWKEECTRFTPSLPVELLAGNLPQRKAIYRKMEADEEGTLYVTSYDLLKRDITFFENREFSSIVLDEAQYIKNQKAAVTKAVKVLHAQHRFALTGTPIENRLSELWSIFDFLMPGFLYSAKEFGERFETPIMKRKDEAATRRLSGMTEPFILRRKKTDVLKDLPEKLEEVQSSAMEEDQRRLYDAQVVHMKELLDSYGGTGEDKMRILAEITRLRQICCDPELLFEDYKGSSTKRQACLELIQRAMDGGHRMLVFSQFTSMLALLSEDLKREKIPFFTITGSTPKQERLRLVNEFNEGDTPVFLISLKAGGTGLNLTGADVVIHYDPWWNLAVQNQATDRAHRIGQTRQVTVIKLITAETIEEKILQLQEAKRDLADAIMGGQSGSLMEMSKEELLRLLG